MVYLSNDNLPKGWVWTTLAEISEIILGQSPPSSTYNTDGKGLPFYQGKLEFGETYPTPRKWCTAPKKIAEKGDIFISVRAPVGPTNLCPEKSSVGRGLAAIRGLSDIEPFFILYLMRAYEDELAGKGVGTTFNAITGNQLKTFEVPLPPLPEQHRIVAKIEKLFTKLDTGINELRKAQSQLKRYRQSVLKAAFEGKLTEAWRAEHQEEIEPAASIVSDLPNGWEWTALEEVSKLNPRIDKQSIDDDLEVTFLPMKNVEELSGKIDLSEIKRFSELKRKSYTPFRNGDILFAKVTPCMENGKIAIAYDLKNGIGFGSTEFHVIRLSEEHSKQFFFFYFLQQKFRQEAKRAMTSGVGLLRVPTDYMRRVPIPLPPLSEQQAIVSEVESRLSIADKVEKTITAELKRAEQLRQSILKKAFSGKLVPQDPNDEPASVLLERIKAEKLLNTQGQLRLKLV